jgi:hypothetical protein
LTADYSAGPSITEQLGDGRPGPKVYDFANGAGEGPFVRPVQLPSWPGYMAHTGTGDDEQIYLLDREIPGPWEPVDMRCSGCTTRSEIALDHEDRKIVFIVHHEPGCPQLEAIRALVTP